MDSVRFSSCRRVAYNAWFIEVTPNCARGFDVLAANLLEAGKPLFYLSITYTPIIQGVRKLCNSTFVLYLDVQYIQEVVKRG